LVFGANGQLSTVNGAAVGTGQTSLTINNEPSNYTWSGATSPSIDFPAVGSQNAVTQFSGNETLTVTSQDGNSAGTLMSYSIGSNGVITGDYSNGNSASLGTLALANFANPGGLSDTGQTYFSATIASGKGQLGQPGTNGYGTLQGGAVISSNVDLATQLTNLIQAQTAYQANTKVVDATSIVLTSLVQMS
jgi:flagellar hook protein FlgE